MNLDPGGYGYLLRLWTELFGTDLVVLKTFSFIFYFLSIVVILKLAFTLLQNPIKKIVASLIIITIYYSYVPRFYAFEIRPYSMALFASSGIALALILFVKNPNKYRTFFLSIMLCLGAWSRYNTYVFVFAALSVLVFMFFLKKISTRNMLHIFALPIFSLIFIYFSTTRFQNSGNPPGYVTNLLLANSSVTQFLHILKANFVDGPGILLLMALTLIFIRLLINRSKHSISFKDPAESIALRAWFVLSILFSMGFSIAGYLPWYLSSRWSIDQYGLVAVAVVIILLPFRNRVLSWVGFLSLLVFLLTSNAINSYKDRWVPTDGHNVVSQNLAIFENKSPIAIDTFNYPETIYLLEKSGIFSNGPTLLKEKKILPFDIAGAVDGHHAVSLQQDVHTLIVSLHWSPDRDLEIQDFLHNQGFILIRSEARKIGGLGYAVYSKR